jgi:putative transposase
VGHPALPKYKDKQKGRNILIYDIQALSKKALKKGLIQPSMLGIEIQTKQTKVAQVRIIPRKAFYMVEVVYDRDEVQAEVNPALMASVDIGLNNLVALTSNKSGCIPRIVNGRPIKSVNQYYNKQREHHQKKMRKHHHTSRKLDRITNKRTRRIDHYMHTASKRLMSLLVTEGRGILIIGKNPLWKQDPTLRKKDAQHFVQLPHARFIEMLSYKAKLVGSQVILQEESSTSKASFLDLDSLPTYGTVKSEPVFSGRRVKRGLYKASDKRKINADVNGSYNIMRKASPNAFRSNGVEGAAVHPVRLAVETDVEHLPSYLATVERMACTFSQKFALVSAHYSPRWHGSYKSEYSVILQVCWQFLRLIRQGSSLLTVSSRLFSGSFRLKPTREKERRPTRQARGRRPGDRCENASLCPCVFQMEQLY